MTIYIVDEDKLQLKPYALEFEVLGYSVQQIVDADAALVVLSSANDVDFVLLDVMLGAQDAPESRFTRDQTDDFLKTGLVLLELLVDANPNSFPNKAAFFSMAATNGLVAEIEAIRKKYRIPFLRKGDYRDPFKLVQTVIDLADMDDEGETT